MSDFIDLFHDSMCALSFMRRGRLTDCTSPARANPCLKPLAMNSMPRVILAPIFSVWFGLGVWSKVALGVTLVFFIVFFNVYQGVREVSPNVLANARMLGATNRQLLRHVYTERTA